MFGSIYEPRWLLMASCAVPLESHSTMLLHFLIYGVLAYIPLNEMLVTFCVVCKEKTGWVFFPFLSLFLGKFGITRSVSGCRLEEDNKAVSIASKLVRAKYHPEAEEYPAYISE